MGLPGPTWDRLGMRRGEILPAASVLVLNVTGGQLDPLEKRAGLLIGSTHGKSGPCSDYSGFLSVPMSLYLYCL